LVSTTIRTTKSEEIFAAAQNLMPGGVSSPVRGVQICGTTIVFDRVKEHVWDVDGNQYIDYVGTGGQQSAVMPIRLSSVHSTKPWKRRTSFGAPSVLENVLAGD